MFSLLSSEILNVSSESSFFENFKINYFNTLSTSFIKFLGKEVIILFFLFFITDPFKKLNKTSKLIFMLKNHSS